LSSLGDTIVIAVIDKGADLTHNDIHFWKNRLEIPGNNMDDDLNGYVDDFDGWNPNAGNGVIPTQSHGTAVSGIVGGRGNNTVGISGVAWDAQIMPLVSILAIESEVVASYAYALEMRARYDASNGTEGAFVVATNSSFGVNQGNPQSFPIWCAMFDSLGKRGILSVAATANIGFDVDQVGDVPTGCSSNYLLSITNTTRFDQLASGAAFGLITIDMGAPGSQILTTTPGDVHGLQSGTSMAAPHVAGAIALMFSGACPAFMVQYKIDPAGVALSVKDFLMQTTDSLGTLTGLTVSGGRLNVWQALLRQDSVCSTLSEDCLPPYNLEVSQVTDTSVWTSWQKIDSATLYRLRYRPLSDTTWMYVDSQTEQYQLGQLQACTQYVFQVASVCNGDTSGFLASRVFRTEGCCEAPANLQLLQVGESSFTLNWQSVFGASAYRLQYRLLGLAAWDSVVVSDTFYVLNNLENCGQYELRIGAECPAKALTYSPLLTATTLACGACLDSAYCAAQGNDVTFEWIREVNVGPIEQFSGRDGGYRAFTSPANIFKQDSTYSIRLRPGYQSLAFREHWRIWIDWNQDGVFEDSLERVLGTLEAIPGEITGSLQVPDTALLGPTRMRIAMKYGGSPDNITPPSPCGSFAFGEVEDFCIEIVPSLADPCPSVSLSSISYDEANDALNLSWTSSQVADEYEVRLVVPGTADPVSYMLTGDSTEVITGVTLGSCQEYTVQLRALCGNVASSWSAPFLFRTLGCGTCLDSVYCTAGSQDAQAAYIRTVELGTISHNSDGGPGYEDFTNISIPLKRGDTYALRLIPGFDAGTVPVVWRVYADFDQNGLFDANDLWWESSASSDTIIGSLSLPGGTPVGPTRLRVVMQKDVGGAACGILTQGQVQDYCMFVDFGTATMPEIEPAAFRLYPNPTTSQVVIQAPQSFDAIQVLDVSGRKVLEDTFSPVLNKQLDLSALPKGLYLVLVRFPQSWQTQRLVKG
ncbi:MAG: GEVED domain-containing protein, partial [Bacteroidota bacterium]